MCDEDEARKQQARVASSSVPMFVKPDWRWAAGSKTGMKTDNDKEQSRSANRKTNRKKPGTLRALAPDWGRQGKLSTI